MPARTDLDYRQLESQLQRALEREAGVRAANKEMQARLDKEQVAEDNYLEDLALYSEFFGFLLTRGSLSVDEEGRRIFILPETTFHEDEAEALFQYLDQHE